MLGCMDLQTSDTPLSPKLASAACLLSFYAVVSFCLEGEIAPLSFEYPFLLESTSSGSKLLLFVSFGVTMLLALKLAVFGLVTLLEGASCRLPKLLRPSVGTSNPFLKLKSSREDYFKSMMLSPLLI